MKKISPLAPASFPRFPDIPGVSLASGSCGLRYSDRRDVFLVVLEPGSTAAGVFTRSKTAAAPVDWCRQIVKGGRGRALVVNSGNANAFTGQEGMDAVHRTIAHTASILGCPGDEVFVASTGVIGETLPDERIRKKLTELRAQLRSSGWQDAASAIMTTDTFPKGSFRTTDIGGTDIVIGGIAKGSGMIAPDMGTMLAFLFTDASLPADILQTLLARGVDKSFNAITVDGDTSTSDTTLMFATGRATHPELQTAGDPRLRRFRAALDEVLLDLAHQIVRDGEGARKFITVTVSGAVSKKAARVIAFSIANSPLVKTAIAGEDANWGRIVMAVGKSGQRADRDRLAISIGGVPVADNGRAVPDYDEDPVAAHMKGQHIDIDVDLNIGPGKATVWTCDLTNDYISINADYRS